MRTKWDQSDLNWLCDNYGTMSIKKMANILHRSRSSIISKAKYLGLISESSKHVAVNVSNLYSPAMVISQKYLEMRL